MFVSYLIKSYLFIILYKSVESVSSHSLLPSHCNYIVDRIDAITNFTNGSLFVSSGQNYWLLRPHEKPIHTNAYKISDLLPEVSTIEAVVNLKTKADKSNRKCVSVNEQLMFYSQKENENIISIYENNKWTVIHNNVSQVDILNAAKSINWSQPIDAFEYFEGIAVIFQGDFYTSLHCEDGNWHQIKHTNLSGSFYDIRGPLDSTYIDNHQNLLESNIYMFKGQVFYNCSIYGSDPCKGPLSIDRHFFKCNQKSKRNSQKLKLNSKISVPKIWLWIIVIWIIIFLLILLLLNQIRMFEKKTVLPIEINLCDKGKAGNVFIDPSSLIWIRKLNLNKR